MKKTEIEIISGFLGCGKTTFIKKIISESEDFSNTVILENEFGEVSIDGEILQREGVKIKEINAGCICCSVAGDFAKSLIEIKDMFDPDKIIIEPSGVGKLSEIISICNKYPETFQLNKIITILDLKNFLMFLTNFGEFYIDQIENANMIIFSRFTDAVNSGTDLVDIENKIREINPKVNIISKEWDNFSIEDLFVEKKKMKKLDMFSHHHHHHHEDGHCCHCSSENKESNNDFESITIAINNEISRETLTNILNDFESGKYGSIIRSKGSVPIEKGSLQFDYVPGEIRINDKPYDTKCHVVIIGEKLDREALEKSFL
ncbi:CobW family GTP-binding protein [Peptostreptococcus porci]|uniref:CobW family GTP-binding protein n=1 Tax=Peptostreptococcus porci TaxID=2652282 RepID=UPI002A90C149|nr:GTP-binding protein [Peptostreptococcus porci]MDY5435677.1 GTP-binding protein [Peptostreptococcus porci]